MYTNSLAYVHKLQHDPDFVDYCKKEIHDIIREGRIDKDNIQQIVNIIVYIVQNESKHAIPREIFADVLEAFIIELLQKYGIQLTDASYQHILETLRSCLRQIVHGHPCQVPNKTNTILSWFM